MRLVEIVAFVAPSTEVTQSSKVPLTDVETCTVVFIRTVPKLIVAFVVRHADLKQIQFRQSKVNQQLVIQYVNVSMVLSNIL